MGYTVSAEVDDGWVVGWCAGVVVSAAIVPTTRADLDVDAVVERHRSVGNVPASEDSVLARREIGESVRDVGRWTAVLLVDLVELSVDEVLPRAGVVRGGEFPLDVDG